MTARRLVQVAEVALGRQRTPAHEQGDHLVPYLRSANVEDGVLNLSDVKDMNFAPSEQAVFSLKTGDVLVTEGSGSKETVGTAAVWHGEIAGTVCFQNTLLRMRPRAGHSDGRFLYWWMRHAHASGMVAAATTGANIQHIGAEALRNMVIDVPSLAQQRRTADLLDDQVARIDEIIRLREEQVAGVDARLSSVLDDRFANPSDIVPMKGLVSDITSGPRGWGDLVGDHGTPFLRVTNVTGFGIEVDTSNLAHVRAPKAEETRRSRVKVNDVLVTITADLGSVAVVREDLAGANVSQHVARLRPKAQRCVSDWLAWCVSSPRIRSALTTSGYGGTKQGLGLSEIGRLRVPAIPVSEQIDQARELNDIARRTRDVMTAMNAEIDLLHERKRSLITAAVTGEFDVTAASGRGVA